jgi:hypothetical protein
MQAPASSETLRPGTDLLRVTRTALYIVTGKVIVQLSATHKTEDFLRLMQQIVKQHAPSRQ